MRVVRALMGLILILLTGISWGISGFAAPNLSIEAFSEIASIFMLIFGLILVIEAVVG